MSKDLRALQRRLIEIDYRYGHRHAATSLSALPIIAHIYDTIGPDDVFILSKGHSCAALYAVLESKGFHPDVTKVHPERDVANGIQMTAGSLGHGLPFALGIAYAKQCKGEDGVVHVLMGDGECLEGTTWESLHVAARLHLKWRLIIHIDANHSQGCDHDLDSVWRNMHEIFDTQQHLAEVGGGLVFFKDRFGSSTVYKITDADYAKIMEELA